jgi:response regulator NasT
MNPQNAQHGQRMSPKPDPSAESRTLLVVDDDKLIVATLGQQLRSAGYRVIEAFDGPSALERCGSSQPDLAILDYLMPGMSGVELARSLAESGPTPVIFLSAYSDEVIVSDAIDVGALTYVVKPIDTEQLLPIVRTALQRGREIRALHDQNQHLRTQLNDDQHVSTATGLLMANLKLGRREAFERLRHKARSKRLKLDVLARDFVRCCDESNRMLQELGTADSTARPAETDPI